jgi:hypothetical protein
MAVPSFNGDYIFGRNYHMTMDHPEGRAQFASFLGIPGAERQYLGEGMYTTVATGTFYANDEFTLGQMFVYALGYKNQFSYVLFDTKGRTWENVALRSVVEAGPPMADPGSVECFQNYRMIFTHLTPF